MKRQRAPAVGTLLYEVGWKDDEPSGPLVVSYVYGGRLEDHGRRFHMLVPFATWWYLAERKLPVQATHGLKVKSVRELFNGRVSWDGVRRWVKKTPAGPRPPG